MAAINFDRTAELAAERILTRLITIEDVRNSISVDITSLITVVNQIAGGTITITQVDLGDGTAADPSMTYAADPDTGFYRIGSNNMGLSLGGTKSVDFAANLTGFTGAITATTTVGVGTSIGLGTDIIGVKEVDHTFSITTSTTTNTTGGAWVFTAGAGVGSGIGGAASLTGGVGGATGAGGAVNVTSGAGGATSGTSGAVTIKTANGATTRASGILTLATGTTVSANSGNWVGGSGAVSTTGNSGTIVLVTGASTTTGDSGASTFGSGTAGTGNSGIVTISSGNATTGNSGNIVIATGTASATKGTVTVSIGGTTLSVGSLALFAVTGAITASTSITATTSISATTSVSAGTAFLAAAGSAGTPAYSFTLDPNTGIINSSANAIGFVTDGVEKWMIASGGGFNPILENSYDIGTGSGGVSPRNIHAATAVFANTISEYGAAAGVTVDGVLLKDGAITTTAPAAGVATAIKFGERIAVTQGSLTALGIDSQWKVDIGGTNYFIVGGAIQFA